MPTILLVEDDRPLAGFLEKAFSSNYSVECAADGAEALSAVHRKRYDLIILDLNLPLISGDTVLKELRKEGTNTPVIILTATDAVSDRVNCLNAGADDYVTKPFSFSELEARVNAVLRRTEDPILRDLARFTKLSLALQEQNNDLKARSNREAEGKATFDFAAPLAATVHDLKNELLNIALATRSLRSIVAPSAEASEQFEMIERSMQYSKGILQRILNLLEYGVGPATDFTVAELLEGVKYLVAPRLRHNIQLKIEQLDEALCQAISAEKEQLTSILVELCTNAATAIGSQPGRIEIGVKPHDKYVSLTVRDNGPGIPSAVRLILLNEQVPNSRGAGLGLYLSARVVRSFGGELRLVATSNHGTEFCVDLPLAESKEKS
jgi:DNA-binding response OmpR family regulator/two-component sensor histidine kinase